MPTTPRHEVVLQLKDLRAGLEAMGTTKLFIDNVSYLPSDFIPLINEQLASAAALDKAHSRLAEALMADRRVRAKVAPKLKGLRDMLRVMYGGSHTALIPFGLAPRKERTPQTAEALILRAERVRATRAARGTKGKKQKKAIKGNVTGVTITPVTVGPETPPT